MFAPVLLDRSVAERPVLRTPGFALALATGVVALLAALAAPLDATPFTVDRHAAGRLVAALIACIALVAVVRSYRDLRASIVTRIEAEAAARAQALTDELTGLYNRRGFRTLAEHQLRIARRNGHDLRLLAIDLDRFKPINDRYGHEEGDRALAEVAGVLRSTMRDTDVIARLGGDEFVVLVVDADEATEEAVMSRLLRAMAQRNALPGRRYSLDATIGIARFDDDRGADLDDLLRSADSSLYRAKGAGRLQRA